MDILTTWLVIYLFVNALFALPVAYVAASKGRSAGGFFLLSFFFSFIVGILVALALPKLESRTIVTGESGSFARKGSEELFKCPYCAEWVKAEAKVCRFCGKEIGQQISQLSKEERRLEEAAARAKEQLAQRQEEERQRIALQQKRKMASLVKNPWVIGLTSLFTIGIVGSYILFQNNVSLERQKLLESKSDWGALMKECDYWMESPLIHFPNDFTYEVNSTNTKLVMSIKPARSLVGNDWIDCVGKTLAVEPIPDDSIDGLEGFSYFIDPISSGELWNDGKLGAFSVEYGNLSVFAERLSEDIYRLTITPAE